MKAKQERDPATMLAEDFRQHLQTFYSCLKLAPPYDSVEKAVSHLTAALKAMPAQDRERLASDPSSRWRQYQASFVDSGLARKHRGIIAGLVRSGAAQVPRDYLPWLELFSSAARRSS